MCKHVPMYYCIAHSYTGNTVCKHVPMYYCIAHSYTGNIVCKHVSMYYCIAHSYTGNTVCKHVPMYYCIAHSYTGNTVCKHVRTYVRTIYFLMGEITQADNMLGHHYWSCGKSNGLLPKSVNVSPAINSLYVRTTLVCY